jgi:hypothetical protein
VPTAAILNQERERWARNQVASLSAQTSFSASQIKQTGVLLPATLTLSASQLKQTGAVLAGAFGFGANVPKQTSAVLSAALGFSGAVSKQVNAVLSAAFGFGASLSKQTSAVLSAAFSFVGNVFKQTGVVLTGSMTIFNATLVSAKLRLMTILASMGFSAQQSRQISVPLAGQLSLRAQTSKSTARSLASSFGFTGASVNNRPYQRAYNATMSAFSTAWSFILTHFVPQTTPSIILPPSSVVFDNFNLPAVISRSAGSELFTGATFVQTADHSTDLGQRLMPSVLLVGGPSGYLTYFVVASGSVTIPATASGQTFNLLLNQNYFTPLASTDPMATSTPQSLAVGTFPWSLICRISGNGKRNGILVSEYNITINGVQTSGTLASNQNSIFESVLQLSLAAQFTGTLGGSDQFQALMTKFELRR